MLRLSRQADYGIVLLAHFVRRDDDALWSARDLAEAAKMPLPTVSKILKALARGGLLASHRGVKGGYALTRDPRAISVAEVVQALEGPIGVTDCSPDVVRTCEHEPTCLVRAPLRRLNHVLRETLDKVSLHELVHPSLHLQP